MVSAARPADEFIRRLQRPEGSVSWGQRGVSQMGGGGQAGSRAFQTRDSSESIFHLPEYACRHGY